MADKNAYIVYDSSTRYELPVIKYIQTVLLADYGAVILYG